MSRKRIAAGLLGASIVSLLLSAAPAMSKTIKVNTTFDEFGAGADCSLREAIQAANTDAAFGGCKKGRDADTIEVRGGKTYVRQQVGSNSPEDANASGDYDVATKIRLQVRGKGRAVLNGGGIDRVLTVLAGGKLAATKLVLRDGVTYPGLFDGGGGVYNAGRLDLAKTLVTENDALSGGCSCGGGIAATTASTTDLDRVAVTANDTANIGGGVGYLGGEFAMTRSTISGNTAQYSGGGIYLGGDGESAKVETSTITGNMATGDAGNAGGGGIFVSDFDDTKLQVVNSTIAGNETNGFGGGVWRYSGDLKLNATTVTSNSGDANATGDGGGGGIAGGVSAKNSIIADNHDPDTTTADCLASGTVSESLTGKNTGCPSGNRTTTKPKLGNLADNGGPTETVALKKGSPAIDRGGKGMPKYDQRGRKRDSKPDLGAYER